MRLVPDDADWPALAALHREAFAEGESAWSAAALESFARSPGAALFVDAPQPRGFALIRTAADEAELATIAVAPAARRGGRARALLGELVAAARTAGAARLFLEVAEDNAAARRLYAGAGFHEIGRRPGYYGRIGLPRIDAVLLALAL